ncbi:hypothetical protein P7C70_g1003, partial [Phenoliferia sp. Uapishka_3]
MDGNAIFSALVAHAATANSATLATPTSAPFGDSSSNKIYAALLANALSSSTSALSASPTLLAENHTLLVSTTSKTTTLVTGFLSFKLESLTTPLPILLSVFTLLLGLFLAVAGSRSTLWASHWGKPRGTFEGRAHIPGGIGGIVFGGVASAIISIFFTLLFISREEDPTLGGWGILAIIFSTALPGAFVAARWRIASRISVGLLGALSLTLLLVTTGQVSSIVARLIVLAIFSVLAILLVLIPQTQKSISIFSGLAASFLIIIGIDLLVHTSHFVDLLGLLVASNGVATDGKAMEMVVKWDTATGKGLVAAWWIVAAASAVWQWYWGAGDVDESWNSYLSTFISSTPSPRGSFTPEGSFLGRLFSRSPHHSSLTALPTRRRSPWDDEADPAGEKDEWDSDIETLAGTTRGAPLKKPAKYGVGDDDEDEGGAMSFLPYKGGERLRDVESRMSGSTVFGESSKKSVTNESDEEEDDDTYGDITASRRKNVGGTIKGFFNRPTSPARYQPTGRGR